MTPLLFDPGMTDPMEEPVYPAPRKPRGRSLGRTEHMEQKNLFSWAKTMEFRYPDLKWMYSVPNAAARSFALAQHMRSEGVRAGVPDVVLPVARSGYHSLYIEMKRKPNVVKPAQREWLTGLWRQGHRVEVCWSFEEARDLVLAYIQNLCTYPQAFPPQFGDK